MRIFFVRHGQTDWNTLAKVQGTTDIPLNETGMKQAEQLCETLMSEDISLRKVYTSYQKRAVKTAEVVSEKYRIDYEIVQGLEEMNLGAFEGHTWDEIHRLYPAELEKWIENKRYNKTPNGESYQLVLERLYKALDYILDLEKKENVSDSNILIVTHGAVIMCLLAIQRNVPFEQAYTIEIENAKPIEFSMENLAYIKEQL